MGNVIYPEKEYYSAKHTNQPINQPTSHKRTTDECENMGQY